MPALNILFVLVFSGIFYATYRSCLELGKRTALSIVLGAMAADWMFTLFNYAVGYRMLMNVLEEDLQNPANQEIRTRAAASLDQSLITSAVISGLGLVFLLFIISKLKRAFPSPSKPS